MIKEFKFLEKYGIAEREVKKINKTEEELEFIKSVEKLSELNQNLKSEKHSNKMVEEYREFVEKMKKKLEENWYFIKVIE